ncbi:hypothetical protein NUW58_g791 [Xylaria curta]|uniref:Uncharacterized protein n=1 Tax=Xylaria curta TaxID=42375 RepID=A0ACC1PPQ2_9PEZI|nr:hypothetical protein NUW58_g791 [Xylaria curta]
MSSALDPLYLLPPDQQDAIINGPALAPPRSDIVANFENPPNMNTLARAVTTITLVLVTIVAVLRAYAKIFIWICHVFIWFNALFYASIEVAGNLSCRPFNRIFDKRIPGECFDRKPLDLTAASVNLLCDIVILLAPQKVIWQLRMTKAKKIGVSVIFAIGLLAIASATGRLVATVQYLYSPDFSYGISSVALWSLAELAFGFFVLCIPTLPRVFKESNPLGRMVKSLLSYNTHSKASGMSTRRNTQVDDGQYHRMQNSQISLVNLPARQATYKVSSATERDHFDSAQNLGPLTNEGTITLTKEFTARETRLTEPGKIESNSVYHTWHSGRDQGVH